jgi:hypothetical protein
MADRRAIPNGFSPNQNQSEFFAPITSECGDTYARNGVRLSRGFQTYLPGPFHFEDAWGQVGYAGYMPAPVYGISLGFRGDVSLKQAPKFTQPNPWQRGAGY